MEDGYPTVATRHKGAPANKYSMQNRLCFTQLVHAQHFVEALQAPQGSFLRWFKPAKIGENAEFSGKNTALRRKPIQPYQTLKPDRRGRR
jgi:hypothetical protein